MDQEDAWKGYPNNSRFVDPISLDAASAWDRLERDQERIFSKGKRKFNVQITDLLGGSTISKIYKDARTLSPAIANGSLPGKVRIM